MEDPSQGAFSVLDYEFSIAACRAPPAIVSGVPNITAEHEFKICL